MMMLWAMGFLVMQLLVTLRDQPIHNLFCRRVFIRINLNVAVTIFFLPGLSGVLG